MGTNGHAEFRRQAARELGVTSQTLIQQGWKRVTPAQVDALKADPPPWLSAAQARLRATSAKRQQRDTARRLGVSRKVIAERRIAPDSVDELLDERPPWLIAAQDRKREHADFERRLRLQADLREALEQSVRDDWWHELKGAEGEDEFDEINARWAPRLSAAKGEARRLAGELTAEQLRQRVEQAHRR